MNIEISPELETIFKKYVLEKHGKLRGKLGEELEKAISLYLIQQSTMKAYVKKRKDRLRGVQEQTDHMSTHRNIGIKN